jgi:hypothetical protein
MSPQKHTERIDGPGASHEEGSRKNPRSTESEKSTFNPRARTNRSEPSIPAIPILTSKATGQAFDRIRFDRAIVADHRARARAQPHSSFVMLRGPVLIEGCGRNCRVDATLKEWAFRRSPRWSRLRRSSKADPPA